jgi:Transposase DDE domain
MFVDWLVEAYYLKLFLQLSRIPHYTILQKFSDRINIVMLGKIISSFILFTDTRHIFTGIDSNGFKITHASEYYSSKSILKRRKKKYTKPSFGADVLKQIICNIKIRRAPTRHDSIDFKPIVTRIAKINPLSVVVVADKGYDNEEDHILVREKLNRFSIIPSRYENVPIWKTRDVQKRDEKRIQQDPIQSKKER